MGEKRKINDAARKLGVSCYYLYRLPKTTPGVYRFGRALRFDPDELAAWARMNAKTQHKTADSELREQKTYTYWKKGLTKS